MNEVAHREPAPPAPNPNPAPISEAQALMLMVERASRDDTINIDKMKELLAMRKAIIAEANEQAFNDAMAKAQGEMVAIARDANNPQTKSKYASYYALDKAVRPIYTKHGFALSFDTEDGAPANYIRIVCYVTGHGHTRKYRRDMPADGKGAKGGDVMTLTHASGAASTYGQRYLVIGIFNLAIGEDTDGNEPRDKGPITAEQLTELTTIMAAVGAVDAKVLAYVSKKTGAEVTSLQQIPAHLFQDVKQALQNWAARK